VIRINYPAFCHDWDQITRLQLSDVTGTSRQLSASLGPPVQLSDTNRTSRRVGSTDSETTGSSTANLSSRDVRKPGHSRLYGIVTPVVPDRAEQPTSAAPRVHHHVYATKLPAPKPLSYQIVQKYIQRCLPHCPAACTAPYFCLVTTVNFFDSRFYYHSLIFLFQFLIGII
jgi:hypothetical protein